MCSNNNGFHKSWSFFLLLTGLKESEGSNLDPKNQLFHEWNFWGVVISTRLPSNVRKKFWKIVFSLKKKRPHFFKIVKRECSFKLETFFMATINRLHIYRDIRTKAIFPYSIFVTNADAKNRLIRPFKRKRVMGFESGSSWAVNHKSWRILFLRRKFLRRFLRYFLLKQADKFPDKISP